MRKKRQPLHNTICQCCGKLFLVQMNKLLIGKGKYCSTTCQYKMAKTRITKICPICNKNFDVFQSNVKRGKGKYCSVKCQHKASENKVERTCKQCGKMFLTTPSKIKFSGAKYCSKQCLDDSKKTSVRRICKKCNKEFYAYPHFVNKGEGIFCSKKCSQMWHRGENNSLWKGGISYGKYCHKFNNELKEKIRNKWDRKCGYCGKPEKENKAKLGVHHINYDKEQGCNGNDFFLIPLCRSCHGKTNHNREKWETILTKIFMEVIKSGR